MRTGGKDNYTVDREIGDQIRETNPHIVEIAVAARAFLVRAVTHLTRERGIRQFLDIGTGLPTANNTHEVAQSVAPESRVVYVDHNPLGLITTLRVRSPARFALLEYALSAVSDSGRFRGRPPAGSATATWSSSPSSCRVSDA